jgi:hypothetical protein
VVTGLGFGPHRMQVTIDLGTCRSPRGTIECRSWPLRVMASRLVAELTRDAFYSVIAERFHSWDGLADSDRSSEIR